MSYLGEGVERDALGFGAGVRGFLPDADTIGALSSTTCLVHCLATPFLFVAHGAAACCSTAPAWWKAIDFPFLAVGLVAVGFTVRTSSSPMVRLGLVMSWGFLCWAVMQEHVEGIGDWGRWGVVPALTMAGFHIYNRQFCRCAGETSGCCADPK